MALVYLNGGSLPIILNMGYGSLKGVKRELGKDDWKGEGGGE